MSGPHRRAALAWSVAVALLLGVALVGRASVDASRDLEAASTTDGVDLARLGFAVGQNAPVASRAAAEELSQIGRREGRAGERARRALRAGSRGARSWGEPPFAALLGDQDPPGAQAEANFGSPGALARLVSLLALVGWFGGSVVLITQGFDGSGKLRAGGWRWAPGGVLVCLGAWLGAVWLM